MVFLTQSRIDGSPFFILLVFAFLGCSTEGTKELPKEPPHVDTPPLSDATIAEWELHNGNPTWFGDEKKGLRVPGFSFRMRKDYDFLATIPEPSTPFGLWFDPFGLNDETVKHLARFRNLLWLDIVDNKITDAGVKEIGRLTQLKVLSLMSHGGLHKRFMPITDAGIAELKGLTNLNNLNFGWTDINGDGLAHLAGMTQLSSLWLQKTLITDENLRHVAAFKNLRSLNLAATGVSDAGLKHLSGLSRLKVLYIHETKVTDAGIAILQQQIAQTKIWHKAGPLSYDE